MAIHLDLGPDANSPSRSWWCPTFSLKVEVTTPGSANPFSTVLGTVGYRESFGKICAFRSLAQTHTFNS